MLLSRGKVNAQATSRASFHAPKAQPQEPPAAIAKRAAGAFLKRHQPQSLVINISRNTCVNTSFRLDDQALWEQYIRNKSPQLRDELLKRFDGLIQSQVNKWAGPVPRQALVTEAKLLAIKAFDSYKPNMGTALGTHVVNGLQPLSRIVYTHQNTMRIPENTALKIQSYNTAVENLKAMYGRQPTTDELHSELGWTAKEISRLRDYSHKSLLESGPEVSGDFFDADDDSDIYLAGVYAELLPEEKELFEMVTGYNGRQRLTNPEIMKKMRITQAQLSYRKSLLTKKVQAILKRYGA